MKYTEKRIKDELRSAGFKRADVSVRQKRNYTIQLETISDKAKSQAGTVYDIAEKCFNEKPHSWLCVKVNSVWIPNQKC